MTCKACGYSNTILGPRRIDRDLARHSGVKGATSTVIEWNEYPIKGAKSFLYLGLAHDHGTDINQKTPWDPGIQDPSRPLHMFCCPECGTVKIDLGGKNG